MKNLFLTLVLLGSTSTFILADQGNTQAEKLSKGLVQRGGVFYPSFDVIGKSYYGGQWYEFIDMTTTDAPWRTTMEDIAQFDGFENAEKMAKAYRFTNENGVGDPNAMLAHYGNMGNIKKKMGYTAPNLQMTTAQKGSLLDAIRNNTLSNADYDELFETNWYNQPKESTLFKTNGQFDTEFTNQLIKTVQANEPYLTADLYNTLGRNFAANPEGTSQTDLSGWETPNLNYFPVNQSNLSWDQINSATNIQQSNFSGMDVSNFQTTGKSLTGIDLSDTNITGPQLNAAKYITGTKLQGTNLSGFDRTGQDLSGLNLTGVSGITGANLNGATSYQSTNFGTLDMTGFTASTNTNFYGANLSNTTNLNVSTLNTASNLQRTNLSGQNLTGFNPTSKSLYYTNLSNTTGLTADQIVTASNIQYTNLTGTGITKELLNAALISPTGGNKTQAQATAITNTITF